MRVMRASIYAAMKMPPLTTIVLDCDVTDSLESVRERSNQADALCLYDIFEVDDDASMEIATLAALNRWESRQQAEYYMAISFHWNAAQLPRVNQTLMNPAPAPLSVEDCSNVLLQLAEHSNYQHQNIIVVSNDQRVVAMQDGKINVESI